MTFIAMTVARVLVDGPSRMGLLSYLVPERLSLSLGDAVLVPFGTSSREGMVAELVESDERATRPVVSRLGGRADPRDVQLALSLAEDRMVPPEAVLRLLSPSRHRDSPLRSFGEVSLLPGCGGVEVDPARNWSRRALLVPPGVAISDAAASEAQRMVSSGGQVLVLCPTLEWASAVRSRFVSGASHLSSSSGPGVWTAWRRGRLPVGVGVRSAAWYSPRRLAGVVVVEDDHPGHVDLRYPFLSAVEVALGRSRAHDAQLSLVSRVHSAAGLGGGVRLVEAVDSSWPSVRVIDRSRFPRAERLESIMAGELARASRAGREVVVVAESRPSMRRCSRCGQAAACTSCSVSGCSHGGEACARCGSMSYRWSGWDASRCAAAFPEASIATAPEVARMRPEDRLVVVPDVSRLAAVPSRSPSALSGSVLVAAAAAAGGRGRLIVGCWDRSWLPLRLLASASQAGFDRAVFDEARSAGLPPFGREVLLSFKRASRPSVPPLPVPVPRPYLRNGVWEVRLVVPRSVWPDVREALRPLAARRSVSVRVW